MIKETETKMKPFELYARGNGEMDNIFRDLEAGKSYDDLANGFAKSMAGQYASGKSIDGIDLDAVRTSHFMELNQIKSIMDKYSDAMEGFEHLTYSRQKDKILEVTPMLKETRDFFNLAYLDPTNDEKLESIVKSAGYEGISDEAEKGFKIGYLKQKLEDTN